MNSLKQERLKNNGRKVSFGKDQIFYFNPQLPVSDYKNQLTAPVVKIKDVMEVPTSKTMEILNKIRCSDKYEDLRSQFSHSIINIWENPKIINKKYVINSTVLDESQSWNGLCLEKNLL